jgi:hypothetical protein
MRVRHSHSITLAMDGYFDGLAEEYRLIDVPSIHSPLPADVVKLEKRADSDKASPVRETAVLSTTQLMRNCTF